ncbi:hypothetical protein IFM89_025603, partial [Coptis chinensis]
FVAEGKIGSACDLLKDLMSAGYRADLSILNSLIEGLCNANKIGKAYKLFQFMVQEGLSPNFVTMRNLGLHVIEDLSNFFSFMVGKGGREYKALETLKYLKARGFCNVSIYSIIIQALHKIGDVKGKQKGFRHDFFQITRFVLYCLNRTNYFRAADQVPELMNMQGKPPTEKQFEILIRMHSDAGRGLRVYYVYEKMKKFGIKPRVFLYNRVMDALVKTDHLDLALAVYEDFKEDGLVEESVTFMILIKGLCREGRIDEAFELLGRMRENLCKPDVFTYTAMIRVLIAKGNLDGCLTVWEEILKDGVDPDAMAHTTLITALCKGNVAEKGCEVFEEMKKKKYLIDRAVYGSLIEAFVAEGKIGSACDLLKALMSSGYRADLSILNSLIEGLCNANKIGKAYKLFQFTVQEGLSPDFVTVNPILALYAEQSRMDEICKLLEQMRKLGLHVIDDLSNFFSFMVGKGGSIIIQALHKIGDVKGALSLFEEMKDSEYIPDSSTYSNVIPCFVDVGDVKAACSCYNKMKEKSWVPTISAYRSLVYGLCNIGEIDAALTLVHDCLGNVTSWPMDFEYTLSIIHACRSCDAKKVIDIDEMMEQGCPLNDLIYSAVISGMCDNGSLEEARKVFTSMRERKLLTEANLIIYEELLIDHMKKKTAGLVLSGLKFFGLESKLKLKGTCYMDWFLVFIFVLLLWVVSLCKVLYASHLSTVSFLSKGEDAQKRKVMLVAFDTLMMRLCITLLQVFFANYPLFDFKRAHCTHFMFVNRKAMKPEDHVQVPLYFLGDSRNADGKGNVRKEELYHDGKGNVRKEELYHAGSSLKDGFDNMWSAILISKIIQEETASQGIDLLITFDSYGISGHRNHRDLHNGICEINVYGLGGSNDHCLSWLLIYFQLSTSIIMQKYSGPIDLWLSALLGSSSRGQRHCLLNEHPVKSFMAMAQHQSQWIWFQELFVVFSSYTYVNTLRRINL